MFFRNSVDCLAPYTVINSDFGKCHFCWTLEQAHEWVDCYDVNVFGITRIYNFNGEILARKGN